MATGKMDSNGLGQESSGEETSTLSASTPERMRDYAYFSPIGEPIHGKDIEEDDKYSEKEERHAFRRRQTYIADEDQRELQRIATAISMNRPSTTRAEQSFRTLSTAANIPLDDPELDPNGPSFSLTKWVRVFMSKLRDEGHNTAQSTGVVFKNVNVSGSGSALQLQPTITSMLSAPLRLGELFSFGKKDHKQILRNFSGHINAGEMLIVLGRPGSGCSTLLKTLTGQLHGLELQKDSLIHFDGIPQSKIIKEFKGETTYNQEVDKHFPHLTVGQTLEFAAACRTASNRPMGLSRKDLAKHIAQVVMAVFGLSHTYNTKVGNDFVRGVSGGERKRVSIAEMAVGHAQFSAWDNSTRGLDSAGALNFVKSLRVLADLSGTTSAVAIYQASQAIYDLFEKAVVLYEGRQIYFGPASKAKAFFEEQGWHCPQRQTTGDFLTSLTNPSERQARDGMDNKVPRTAEDFEKYWLKSAANKSLQQEIAEHEKAYPHDPEGHTAAQELREEKILQQAKHVRPKSPYLISIWMQIQLCVVRGYQRIWGDISAQATTALVNIVAALIIGSLFFGTADATVGFYGRGSVLFLGVLMNALTAIAEINSLYDQRPIVEKHNTYAYYHPWTEAAAGIVCDLPVKFMIAVCFNVILYFLSGLRREPSQFFLYFLITYTITFVMAAIFRMLAAVTKTVSQAMALAGIMILALVIYTGFAITTPEMKVWFSWIRWINPLYYAFEILIANEFHGRDFTCSARIPAYSPSVGDSWVCDTVGAVAGQAFVNGDAFINQNYQYYYSHVWRNFGIMIAFLVAFMAIYFVAVELNSNTASAAEQLVFQRGHVPAHLQAANKHGNSSDEEAPGAVADGQVDKSAESDVKAIPPQKDIFTWQDVVYEIDVKDGKRKLLDNVAGYVKPGTLTALMGVSGAGKTTLLDVLAQRTTMGVITGDMLVNGKTQDASFQRKTGYVQQQDLHLETATVRESLRFSALLRQPKTTSKKEKFDYVEDVIDMLNMREFADAIVGVPGTGLNVEQRKLLTIGVELAAKPKLLLFLDEPTSGLDSQSSWAICAFLRKLADAGQAILCTIHQPSAILFQEFDRLLFLAKGGKTVYFGPIGKNSRTLLDYFESHGGRKCDDEENPAEYMLEIVNQGKNDKDVEWFTVWGDSDERNVVLKEIDEMHASKRDVPEEEDPHSGDEFAMPFGVQLVAVTSRVFQQYWRMPSYVFAKSFLAIAAGLFIGFSFFQADGSLAGMQNVIFSVFMLTTIFSTLVQQIQPLFVTQRSLYEVRERPSKSYSWKAFMIANIVVEIPYQVLAGVLSFACYYYAVNGIQTSLQQGLVLLYVVALFIYASTFAHMTIAALPDAQTASAIVSMLLLMMLMFNGVLQTPSALPGFWIFMYRVSPFTYWISGIVSTSVHGRLITCSDREFNVFSPPGGQTCGQYMAAFLQTAPGSLENPNATADCRYCSLTNADQFAAGSSIYWSEKWRNYGIFWAFIVFNAFVAVFTYWAFRVKKWKGVSFKSKKAPKKETEKKESTSHFNLFRR